MDQIAFQIALSDNVATALTSIAPGAVRILGEASLPQVSAITDVPRGHKLALSDIAVGQAVMKYAVPIGIAVKTIHAGEWVHLHNIKSAYDERSSHLDVVTGEPTDTSYE